MILQRQEEPDDEGSDNLAIEIKDQTVNELCEAKECHQEDASSRSLTDGVTGKTENDRNQEPIVTLQKTV